MFRVKKNLDRISHGPEFLLQFRCANVAQVQHQRELDVLHDFRVDLEKTILFNFAKFTKLPKLWKKTWNVKKNNKSICYYPHPKFQMNFHLFILFVEEAHELDGDVGRQAGNQRLLLPFGVPAQNGAVLDDLLGHLLLDASLQVLDFLRKEAGDLIEVLAGGLDGLLLGLGAFQRHLVLAAQEIAHLHWGVWKRLKIEF